MTTIAVLGSLDTKSAETRYLAERVRAAGAEAVIVDTSAGGSDVAGGDAAVPAAEVAAGTGLTLAELGAMDRADAVRAMAAGAAAHVAAHGRYDGLLAAGGSNAALVFSRAAAVLPFGRPKVIVTTMAVVDARSVVGDSDVTIVYPVADIEGLNSLTRPVLAQAASAVVAMAGTTVGVGVGDGEGRPVVAATMFGVTTPCVQQIRTSLEASGDEVIVFHANGTGGRSMERLADEARFVVIVDVTTTELADLIAGGDLDAGPDRLTPARGPGVPRVVAPGACDMANFGAPHDIPTRFAGRTFHLHNDIVSLMRTTPEENEQIGALIGSFVAARTDSVAVLPLRGVSALDRDGGPFWDPQADDALFDAIRAGGGRVVEVDAHINDPTFARAVIELVGELRPGR